MEPVSVASSCSPGAGAEEHGGAVLGAVLEPEEFGQYEMIRSLNLRVQPEGKFNWIPSPGQGTLTPASIAKRVFTPLFASDKPCKRDFPRADQVS